jgi:glycosyltransferase involved in cell wall biosynthesis
VAARPDVTLFPQQSIFPARAPGAAVLTVGDVQHLFHPENFGLFDRTFRPRAYPRSMERAERIIAVSRFTLRTLEERCGVPPGKGVVVPHGVDRMPEATPAIPGGLAPGTYLYFPATTWPHKGHDRLLRAFAALRRSGRLDGRLVLTGQRTPSWERRLVPLARTLGVEGDVLHLGLVSRGEVAALLAGSLAVVFPTRFEGFGIPVVEAASVGARVVASRLEVFDEIGLPSENQIDFDDPEALARALELPAPTRLLHEPLAWTEVARRTAEVLRATATAPVSSR